MATATKETEPETTETPEETPEQIKEAQEQATKLLLDFSVPLTRVKNLAPNGETYELRTLEEFSAEDEHIFKSERTRYGELESKDKLDPKERAEYAKLLHTLFEKVVVANEETMASFKDAHRQKVLVYFTVGQIGDNAQTAEMANQMMRRGILPITES